MRKEVTKTWLTYRRVCYTNEYRVLAPISKSCLVFNQGWTNHDQEFVNQGQDRVSLAVNTCHLFIRLVQKQQVRNMSVLTGGCPHGQNKVGKPCVWNSKISGSGPTAEKLVENQKADALTGSGGLQVLGNPTNSFDVGLKCTYDIEHGYF